MPYMLQRNVNDGSVTKIDFLPETAEQRLLFASIAGNFPVPAAGFANIPSSLLVEKNRNWKRLPDILGLNGGPYVLSSRLHDELQRVEPGVHRFTPIAVRTTTILQGSVDHGMHFLLLESPAVDCLIYSKTSFLTGGNQLRLDEEGKMVGGNPSYNPRDQCTMRKEAIAGRHIWRLPHGSGLLMWFCSDHLQRFYKENKMKGWDLSKHCQIE